MRQLERRLYRTPRMAAQFFRDAHAQGFSVALLVAGDEFEVVVWG